MKLLFIIGNSASGKMTVGQELCKITPFRLFHNHMAIEPVLEVFGSFHGPAIHRIREVFFEEFAKTDNFGLIFTFMWAFDMQSDWDYLEHVKRIFSLPEEDIYYVELLVPQALRLERNHSENRLKNKASKRDLQASDARLLRDDQNHRCESLPGEIPFPNYLRLDNSNITAAEAAKKIKEFFNFK
jgi:hypothetical protein